MDLKKFLPSLDAKKNEEFFWALSIEPNSVQAAIWKIDGAKANVVHTSSPSAWGSDEELIDASDAALSSAIQDFPSEFKEPGKTVFGVSYSWVKEGEIAKEYLDKIKKVCKELSLTPVGFVVLPEAISHFVKSEEESPLTGIVIGIYKENLEISLFELGKLSGTTHVARSVSVVDDTIEGLTRLSMGRAFPSRMIIYGGKESDLEEARQSLIATNWDVYENIKFLHTPKIELTTPEEKIYAVSLAGASEIGNATKLEISGDKVDSSASELMDEDEISPEELGFVMEKDVNAPHEEKEGVGEADTSLESSEFKSGEHENIVQVSEEELYPTKPVVEKKHLPLNIKKGLLNSFAFARKINFKFPSFSTGQKPLLLGVIIFLFLIALGGIWWWFYPTAVVTIYVSPQTLEEKVSINVSSNDDTDLSGNKLAGTKIETSVGGEKSKETTGTKTIGDKAKGEITIYRVGTSLSLPGGTTVYGPQSLKYVMDEAVVVASGSASSPSETEVSVVAETIGAQYNLSAGSTFTVGNYSASDMEGKNNSAFTGGSSREINAVAKSDQDDLREELQKELSEAAINKLEGEVPGGKLFIKESEESETKVETFSNKVGDESDTLKLNLTVDATGVVVDKNELIDLSKEILKTKIPNGFTLRGEQITFEFAKKQSEEGDYQFDTRIIANLLPEIKTDELANKIAGKYPILAEEYLKRDAPGFVRAEIKMKYALPGKLKTLPHVAKNIQVEVAAER